MRKGGTRNCRNCAATAWTGSRPTPNSTNAAKKRPRERSEISEPEAQFDRGGNRAGDEETFLVTGTAGLLGAYLTPMLRDEYPDARIIAAVRGAAPDCLSACEGTEIVRGDLREPGVWREMPNAITRVFHLAARLDRRGGNAELALDNLAPVARLIEHCAAWPHLRQIVYASSVSVYGDVTEAVSEMTTTAPGNLYAAAKLAGEVILTAARGTCVTNLRFSSLYGAGMRPGAVLPAMIQAAVAVGEITVYGRGRRMQDFLYAGDAGRACIAACRREARGVFNVGAGTSTTMADLARNISDVFTDGAARVTFVEDKPEGGGGYVVDVRKAAETLGFRPSYDLAAGLREMKKASGAGLTCTPFRY